MKLELEAVVDLMQQLLHAYNKEYLSEKQIDRFGRCLKRVLYKQWITSWYPNDPNRGSGFRTLWVYPDEGVQSFLTEACEVSLIYWTTLRQALPLNFTIWVNPGTVKYRIGESGVILTVYSNNHSYC